MERAGLDAANYYRAIESVWEDRDRPGGWGLVGPEGERDPAWWILQRWSAAAGTIHRVTGDDPRGDHGTA